MAADPTPTYETLLEESKQDAQTVTPAGTSCARLPEGVRVRDLIVHTDERGTVCEMYDPRWNWHPDPLVFSYYYTIRPGWVKGWAVHKMHDDRYCILQGEMKVVLYDSRPDSPTYGLVSEVYLTEQRRSLLSIPPGVWHADQNVGEKDVLIVNFPTIQYDHTKPDKYRLPVDTDLIPYKFTGVKGY